jgi:protein-S-isoprenylcysteine O-methyltransferase Ste14
MSEQSDIRRSVFKYRSYTPIPFLILMVLFARPTLVSMLLGALGVCLGEALRFWGVSIAGSETRTTGNVGGTYLITNGPFAYVRNPLYLGNMVMYAGIGIMSMAIFPWLLLAAMVWFYIQYSLIVTSEEEYLGKRFEDAYTEYQKNVRRFLPRFAPYRSPQPPDKTVDFHEGLVSERRTLQAIGLVMLLLVIVFFIRGNG